MRRTWPHNPRGFERLSWNYRCLQLRNALGWGQVRLARVMNVSIHTVRDLEMGEITRPSLETIRRIKALELAYEDILTIYKKAPVRNNRLHRPKRGGHGVYLLPIEIRRPEDLQTLGKVEVDSEPMFFGRGSRKKVQQAGMSMFRKARNAKRSKSQSRTMRAKYASGWRPPKNNSKVQSGQSDGERD